MAAPFVSERAACRRPLGASGVCKENWRPLENTFACVDSPRSKLSCGSPPFNASSLPQAPPMGPPPRGATPQSLRLLPLPPLLPPAPSLPLESAIGTGLLPPPPLPPHARVLPLPPPPPHGPVGPPEQRGWSRPFSAAGLRSSSVGSSVGAPRRRPSSSLAAGHRGRGAAQGVAQEPTVVLSAARHGRHGDVEAALDAGFDATFADAFGNTLFHVACQNGHKRIAQLALRYGADNNAQNEKGNTGLHFLFSYGYPVIAEYFIEKGANEYLVNDMGKSAREGVR